MALGIDLLAREVCHAVQRLRGDQEAWIDLDRLEGEEGLGLTSTLLDAAIAFAAAKGWLMIARDAHAVACLPRHRGRWPVGPEGESLSRDS
ncbi:MAG: hypothetical protein U1E60_19700 [Reyranellaceae bacterium]